jgi:hypothetical protein
MIIGPRLPDPRLSEFGKALRITIARIMTLPEKTLGVFDRVSIFITSSSLNSCQACICVYY